MDYIIIALIEATIHLTTVKIRWMIHQFVKLRGMLTLKITFVAQINTQGVKMINAIPITMKPIACSSEILFVFIM